MERSTDQGPIVVGNDGSDFSLVALDKAFWLGQSLGLPVRVIRAWAISTAPRPASWSPGFVPPVEDFEAAVRADVERDLAPVRAKYPDVEVVVDTPHGAAGRELVRASEGARLLVLGSRGLGGFRGLLLGSVTNQVVEHAACDVLVVRKPDGDPAPGRRRPLDQALSGE